MLVISGDGLPFGAQLRRLRPLLHGARRRHRRPVAEVRWCPAPATCPVVSVGRDRSLWCRSGVRVTQAGTVRCA